MEYVAIHLHGQLQSFLSSSTQWVVDGTYSSYSVLYCNIKGRLLKVQSLALHCFLCINDITIDINIHAQLWLFTDDCLVYRLINSVANHQTLQTDMDTLNTLTIRLLTGSNNTITMSIKAIGITQIFKTVWGFIKYHGINN